MRQATADRCGCPVLVADEFVRPAPSIFDIDSTALTFSQEIPHFSPSPPDESGNDTHGHNVTLMLAARFNPTGRTGANPFSDCLDITGVQIGALSQSPGDRSDRAELSGREVHPQLLAERRKHLRGCRTTCARCRDRSLSTETLWQGRRERVSASQPGAVLEGTHRSRGGTTSW